MEITRVNVYPIESESKLLAFATITVDEELVVKNFKIFDGKNGAFVSFPSEIEVNSAPVAQEVQPQMQKNYSDDNLPETEPEPNVATAAQQEQSDKPKNKANASIYSDKTKNYLEVFNGKVVD